MESRVIEGAGPTLGNEVVGPAANCASREIGNLPMTTETSNGIPGLPDQY
jgi:hypothetical protein